MKVQIKRIASESNAFSVNMRLTEGAVLALKHALDKHAEISPVASDLLGFVKRECESVGIKI